MAEPEIIYTDPSHSAINEETGEVDKIALHSNLNDGRSIVQNTDRMLGRTDPERGPTQEIEVEAPLVFEDETLSIDLSAIEESLNDLGDSITALETALTSDLGVEETARIAADAALDARLDAIEGAAPAADTYITTVTSGTPTTPTGIPAGKTVVRWHKADNRPVFWDPDSSVWRYADGTTYGT